MTIYYNTKTYSLVRKSHVVLDDLLTKNVRKHYYLIKLVWVFSTSNPIMHH